jgi:two-component system, NtrC family, response regulator AlgB
MPRAGASCKLEGAVRVLLVEDDASLRRTLRITVEALGHAATEAATGAAALAAVRRAWHDVAVVDLRLGRESGIDVLGELLAAAPGLVAVVSTAYATVETAVAAVRRGAYDYLPKPFTPDQLRAVLDRAAEVGRLRSRVAELQDQLDAARPGDDLFTTDPRFERVLEQVRRVAASDATVLLRGESGVGKGVMARRLHGLSARDRRPFVTVSCPSLSAELLESELFGHAQGSFTGAVKETHGKVAAADGGTLFLDEIGDLPPALQPKLLRFLQEREYERVGETRTRTADVRVVAATNRDLKADVAAGRFREDLLFRLEVIEFTLPPLRERAGDILPLARHYLGHFARQLGKPVGAFRDDAVALLRAHRWPGNLRELRNAVERAVILADGPEVVPDVLPDRVRAADPARVELGGAVTLEALEAEHIRRVLAAAPSLEDAAQTLGIDASTLYRKRKKLGL